MGQLPDDASDAIGQDLRLSTSRGRWGSKLGARREFDVVLAVVCLAIAVMKDTSGDYVFAGLACASLLFHAALPWMRSKGMPEWTAEEAYITRWRRWRRSVRTTD